MLYKAARRIRLSVSGDRGKIALGSMLFGLTLLALTFAFTAQGASSAPSSSSNSRHDGQALSPGRARKSATPTPTKTASAARPTPTTGSAVTVTPTNTALPTATAPSPAVPTLTSTSVPVAATATLVAPIATATQPPAPSVTATFTVAPTATPRAAAPLILFGLGPEADSAKSSPLNQAAPLGMYSSWYNGTKDLAWMQYWYTSGFIRNSIYGTGRAAHLIIWSDGPNVTSPVCGRPYPVSTQILADMQTLATYWAGAANGPPLYVTLFTEFQTYPCIEDQWVGAQDYYNLLKTRMLQIRDIFHQYAPNSRVSIGWGGWQTRWDDPTNGGGASLIPYFADIMSQMDFQSTQLMNNDANVQDAQRMVSALGQYGPVMVAHYKPENTSDSTFYADISTIMTSSFLGGLVSHGLFAWSFMDQACFNDMSNPAEVTNYGLVLNAVQTFGKAP